MNDVIPDQKLSQNPEALSILSTIGQQADADINLFEGALALASIHQPALNLVVYRDHMNSMIEALKPSAGLDDLSARVKAVNTVFFDMNDYRGDIETYDSLENANIISVIERRVGLPVSLSLLYIHLVRSVGWPVEGLNFPGHFIVRMDEGAERMIVDPFLKGKILQAPDLRKLIKMTVGATAELSANYYNALNNREILLRLENNIKVRLIRSEQFERAANLVETMRLIAPEENRLLYDMGLLSFRLKRYETAVENLQTYHDRIESHKEKLEIRQIINEIKTVMG